jgi:hypothetical protein
MGLDRRTSPHGSVLQLEAGRVVEQGSHEEPQARGGGTPSSFAGGSWPRREPTPLRTGFAAEFLWAAEPEQRRA